MDDLEYLIEIYVFYYESAVKYIPNLTPLTVAKVTSEVSADILNNAYS